MKTRFKGIKVITAVMAVVIVIALGFVIHGCSGGGSSSGESSNNNIHLSGTIGNGYTPPAKPTGLFAKALSVLGLGTPAYAVGGPFVDQVIAIPVNGGSLAARDMASSVTSAISTTDQTFSLSLSKSADWLLVLIDSTATGTNRFVGSLGISTGSDSLLNLPATDAAIATLGLGLVSRPVSTSNDAVSANTVTGTQFSMSAAQLTTLAKTDDVFRNAKNIINNYDLTSKVWYQLRPDFFWKGDYAGIQDADVAPTTYAYNGYNFQFDSNSIELTMDDICGTDINGNPTTKKTVELYPSGTVTTLDGLRTYPSTTSFSNDLISCGTKTENGLPVRYGSDSDFSATGYNPISYTFAMGNLGGDIPPGYWDYKVNGTTKASFDVAVSKPFNSSGLINVPVPVLKVNTTIGTLGAGLITSVDVTWYILNDAGNGYVLLTDRTILKHLIGSSDWAIESPGVQFNRENNYFIPTTETTITPTQEWYYNNTDASIPEAQRVNSIQLFYEAGGNGHYFQYTSW